MVACNYIKDCHTETEVSLSYVTRGETKKN